MSTVETGTPVWQEPVRGQPLEPSVLGLSGIERMRAAVQRRLPAPPIHHLTGLMPVEVGPGMSTFTMPASPWWGSPAGVFNAGVMAFLADAALGSAILTALPAGQVGVTSDLTMSFLRPASTSSRMLIGRAQLVHAGRSLGLAEIVVEDADGRLLGHGTTRCFLLELVSPPPEPPEELVQWEPVDADPPDPYKRPVQGEIVPQDLWNRHSGLEVSGMLARGELEPSPLHHFLGVAAVDVEEGTVGFRMPASGWLMSPAGTVYGGAIALLADVAMTVAVSTTVPAATVHAPLDLKVNFLRPVFADGADLTCRATVTHRGRTFAVTTCEITNAAGKPVATATGSSVVVPGRAWTFEPVVAADEATAGG